MTKGHLSPENSLEDIKVRIRQSYKNPNVGNIQQIVLKEGPRSFRIATALEILDPKNNKSHHYSLKLDQIKRNKEGWFYEAERSIRLEGGEENEIEKLFRFLQALLDGKFSGLKGEMHIIGGDKYAKLENLIGELEVLPSNDKIQLVKTILKQLDSTSGDLNTFLAVFESNNVDILKHISVASRLITYRLAIEKMKELIEDPTTKEPEFQKHLEYNPWMFGSEYSELLPRRTWTRDDNLDFMLRRTVDNYLEIIEIKTAFRDALFLEDKSHESFYPSSKLSPVVGQVIRYIEEVERSRDAILGKDGYDPLKIRAKVIVGRDGNTDQKAALRKFNSHLHGIEIMTFDQLIRIADRVIALFSDGDRAERPAEVEDDDIPF